MSKLVPLGDHIVVKAPPKEKTTKSGIVIPDTASEDRPQEGEVIAVGPGELKEDGGRSPIDVKVGDTIMFKKYAPDEFEVEGEKVLVLRTGDVIAKIEN